EMLAIDDFLDRRWIGFSHCHLIKVAVAGGVLQRPRHVLLVEPSRGVEVMRRRGVRDALSRVLKDGCWVVMAWEVLLEVCDV
ncbi:ABC transporter, partial [Massilia sp. CT11-108]